MITGGLSGLPGLILTTQDPGIAGERKQKAKAALGLIQVPFNVTFLGVDRSARGSWPQWEIKTQIPAFLFLVKSCLACTLY